MKKQFGDEVAIIGKSMGPWTLAYHVFGVETFLLMTIDDPDMTMRILDKLTVATYLFADAQIAAGADAICVPDHATGDLVSGEYYKRFLQDIHTEMAERINAPLILHICGQTLDRMPYIAQTGMAAFHFDSRNDPQAAMDAVDGGITLQAFIHAGLIDEITISIIPVLIGEGIPLFGPLAGDLRLHHVSTRSFPSGLVQVKYRTFE